MSGFVEFQKDILLWFAKNKGCESKFHVAVGESLKGVTPNDDYRDGELRDKLEAATGEKPFALLSGIITRLKGGEQPDQIIAVGLYYLTKIDQDLAGAAPRIEKALFGKKGLLLETNIHGVPFLGSGIKKRKTYVELEVADKGEWVKITDKPNADAPLFSPEPDGKPHPDSSMSTSKKRNNKKWYLAALVLIAVSTWVIADRFVNNEPAEPPRFALQVWIDTSGSLQDVHQESLLLVRAVIAKFLNNESAVHEFQIATFAGVIEEELASGENKGHNIFFDGPIKRCGITKHDDLAEVNLFLQSLEHWGPSNFELTLLAAAKGAEVARDKGLLPIVVIISDGNAEAYTTEDGRVVGTGHIMKAPETARHNSVWTEITGESDGSNELRRLHKAASKVYTVPIGSSRPAGLEFLAAIAEDQTPTSSEDVIGEIVNFVENGK